MRDNIINFKNKLLFKYHNIDKYFDKKECLLIKKYSNELHLHSNNKLTNYFDLYDLNAAVIECEEILNTTSGQIIYTKKEIKEIEKLKLIFNQMIFIFNENKVILFF